MKLEDRARKLVAEGCGYRKLVQELNVTRSYAEKLIKQFKEKSNLTRPKRILVIPDAHAKPDHNNRRFEILGKFINDNKFDYVVCLGDFADMHALSSYDIGKKSFEGRTYKADIASAVDAQKKMFSQIKDRGDTKYIMLLGNHEHRINRAIDSDRKLDGTISTEDLQYEKFGWEVHPFQDVVNVEGVNFTHYFANGLMARPISGANPSRTMLNKLHSSSCAGHRHDLSIATDVLPDGKRMWAIVAGCFLDLDQFESFVPQSVQASWWKGLTIMNDVVDGDFSPEFVTLKTLYEKYSK
jgi:hypothetical protein